MGNWGCKLYKPSLGPLLISGISTPWMFKRHFLHFWWSACLQNSLGGRTDSLMCCLESACCVGIKLLLDWHPQSDSCWCWIIIQYLLSHILCYIHHLHTPPTLTTNKKTQAPPEIFQNLTGHHTQPNHQNPPKLHTIHGAMTLLSINSTGGHFTLSLSRSQHKKSQEWKSVSSWLVTAPNPTNPFVEMFQGVWVCLLPRPSPKKGWCGFWERINYNF